jgi:hypothetical protein
MPSPATAGCRRTQCDQLADTRDWLPRHLFALSVDELAAILDTFPVLRRREEKTYGEFRTKRLVLEWYDKV